MNISDLLNRVPQPEPWSEGEKIPWDYPAFSQRMLQEHLSQAHDAASRRFATIDAHVLWIHQRLLFGRPSAILDLGCGPGLYAHRLARLGHTCLGIDFSPASIAYARQQSDEEKLACSYVQEDLRSANFGHDHGLVMFIYGELNVFRPADARKILHKAHQALGPGGTLLLEVHTYEVFERMGKQPPRWQSKTSGLFSNKPHLELYENIWNAEQAVLTERYYIVDAEKGEVTPYTACNQAYTQAQYQLLLAEAGFSGVTFHHGLGENTEPGDLFAITARR